MTDDLSALDAEAHSMLVEARAIVEAVVMGVAHEEPHRKFAGTWLRRIDALRRRYYENATRNGWVGADDA